MAKLRIIVFLILVLFCLGISSVLADDEATPEVTPEPEVTPVVTATPDDDDDLPVIIVIEGPVAAVNVNIITIYHFNIIVNPDNPVLTTIQIGDIIRVEGELDDDDVLIVGDDDDDLNVSINITIINVQITFINIEVFVNVDGSVYRDSGNCNNPPPPWAPAVGWRNRCGSGRGDNDDDDDD